VASEASFRPAAEPRVSWLFLDLNSYFASVEQELRPELRDRPVAVVPVMADTSCAIAASYQAKAFGVRTGTQIGEAKRMCPGLVLVEARHEVYVDYHNRIVEAVERCIPVSAVMSIDDWYFGTNAPEQLRDASNWRAIETGLPVVRAASLGYSMVVDQRGRTVSQAPLYGTREVVAEVQVPERPDLFPLLPVFPYLSVLSLVGIPIFGRWRSRVGAQ